MKLQRSILAIFTTVWLLPMAPSFAAADAELLKAHGALLFADEFNRTEKTPGKEDIGAGWTANSGWRAKGNQQVFLRDGAMQVIKHAEADHGVAIFHDVAFQDGAVQLRFKLGAGDDLGLDFVDRELKTVHAGHLAMARVTLKGVTITDSKTGGMNNEIRERRLKGDKSPELAALLKTKTRTFPNELTAGEWHTLLVVVEGDVMRVTIDGKAVGQFQSEGIAHPTKRMITLAVNRSAWVDDVKVWKLK
jgi:hypothetical protein